MKKQSLYNINEKQRELINKIEELYGEITPEIELALEITKDELQVKSIAYLEFIKSMEAFNLNAKAEIKRLQALVKRNQNIEQRLKSVLLDSVKTFGEYQTPLHKFGTRKSTSVEIEDQDKIPMAYLVRTVTVRPDKAKIKEAITQGQEVPGAKLKSNLNLKIS